MLGIGLVFVDDEALQAAQGRCVTRSVVAEWAVGFGSVAEAAALGAAGPEARLVLARIGMGRATCALAEGA